MRQDDATLSVREHRTTGQLQGRRGLAVVPGPGFDGPEPAGGAANRIVLRRRLFDRLAQAGRVTTVTGPAGSGKSQLVRSWLADAGLSGGAAWVFAEGTDRAPQAFWIAVIHALRATPAGSTLISGVTAAPDLDAAAVMERVLADLATLDDPVWLVIDDAHWLGDEVLGQLRRFLSQAPAALRSVLIGRRDLNLGLHRLRLEGQLTELRANDLRFTPVETWELFASAGVVVPDAVVAVLHERTEGWAAGLRLAALLVADQPDPERLAAQFSGTDRTVAEYLLAEVLGRQPDAVRRMLLRTSILERVNGDLADLLTGSEGSERILEGLEDANAFVVALDQRHSWFRYHPLFAELLRLELRATAPGEVRGLHRAAAGWYASRGYAIEAVRHAQTAGDWGEAVQVLSDHFFALYLDGRGAAVAELLSAFPTSEVAANPELAALVALSESHRGSVEAAERHVAIATHSEADVPLERRGRLRALLAVARLSLARRHLDVQSVVERADELLGLADAGDAAVLGGELLAITMVNLGSAEVWAGRREDAERHLERGRRLAQNAGRPWLEFLALVHLAALARLRSAHLGEELGRYALELAAQHGWSDEPEAGIAYATLGSTMVLQGRLDEADEWLGHAERVLDAGTQPIAELVGRNARGLLEAARGRRDAALAAFRACQRARSQLPPMQPRMVRIMASQIAVLARMGETALAETILADLEPVLTETEARIARSSLRLAYGDANAASEELAPVLADLTPLSGPGWAIQALAIETAARTALGDTEGASHALERAFELGARDSIVVPFALLVPDTALERHARSASAHSQLLATMLPALSPNVDAHSSGGAQPLIEPLTDSEVRVLRYLPTNLAAPEIAKELHLSVHTVRTHTRHVFDKLGVHSRTEAVRQARALGLLGPGAL